MKKLLLLLTLCASAIFAQTVSVPKQEVSGGVGVAVTSSDPVATKIQVLGSYGYNFTPTEAIVLSYDYTPLATTNANTFLGTFKRSFSTVPFGSQKLTPFLSVGIGATDFSGTDILKFTTRFGAGASLPIKSLTGVKLTFGAYGTKIDTLPVTFSTGVTLSKSF
jgi:hypothetical protein